MRDVTLPVCKKKKRKEKEKKKKKRKEKQPVQFKLKQKLTSQCRMVFRFCEMAYEVVKYQEYLDVTQ